MIIPWLTIITAVFASLSSVIVADDPCRIQFPKGVIDLTSVGRTDGSPAYKDKIPPTGSSYSMLTLFFSSYKLLNIY